MIGFLKKQLKNFSVLHEGVVYGRYFVLRYLRERRFADKYVRNASYKMTEFTLPGRQTFFGYYNRSPFSADNSRVLFHASTGREKRESMFSRLEIYCCDPERTESSRQLAVTKAWNWQQGAMLQWLPHSSDTVIFNDYDPEHDRYFARRLNADTGKEERFNMPFYSWSSNQRFFLTLNFRRLAAMRPDYGYFSHRDSDLPDNGRDGVFRYDQESGKSSLILSLAELSEFNRLPSMEGADHKVNHIDIAPDSRKFMFLHRWKGPKGRFSRLIAADAENGKILHSFCTGMVSHSCWSPDSRYILSFCCPEGKENGYWLFDTENPSVPPKRFFEKLKTDGHPSISDDGKNIITDCYPSLSRFSSVFTGDFQQPESCIRLCSVYQPLCFRGELRIDLHPRWDHAGKYCSFDSGHVGKRCFCVLKMK